MQTQVDRVWARIKEKAKELADANQSISYRQARNTVMEFWESECTDDPRDEAIDFLASELIDHVAQYKQRATA